MLKKERGFVMIELLLVLVGAVLFVNMTITTKNSLESVKLYKGAREIQTMIRQAQDQAYGQGHTYYVGIYKDISALIKNTTVTRRAEMPRGIEAVKTNFPTNKVKFKRKLIPSRGGTIWLESKKYHVRITVLPVTGRVKIYPVAKKTKQ